MDSRGGVAAKSSGRLTVFISFVTILDLYLGRSSIAFVYINPPQFNGWATSGLEALLPPYLAPYLHLLDDCELLRSCRLDHTSVQLSACEVVPVRLPLWFLKGNIIDVLVTVNAVEAHEISCICLGLFEGRSTDGSA